MWVPQNSFDDKSTLVQVMAWCRQAWWRHQAITWTTVDQDMCCQLWRLNQCWPRSVLPYGVTMPQWDKEYTEWTAQLRWHGTISYTKEKQVYFIKTSVTQQRSSFLKHQLNTKTRPECSVVLNQLSVFQVDVVAGAPRDLLVLECRSVRERSPQVGWTWPWNAPRPWNGLYLLQQVLLSFAEKELGI